MYYVTAKCARWSEGIQALIALFIVHDYHSAIER